MDPISVLAGYLVFFYYPISGYPGVQTRNLNIALISSLSILDIGVNHYFNMRWNHLVLSTFRPHDIAQKLLRIEHYFNFLQKPYGLSLKSIPKLVLTLNHYFYSLLSTLTTKY